MCECVQGYSLRLSSELGGAAPGGGSLKYLKSQGHLSWAAQLAEGLSFHIEAGAGAGWWGGRCGCVDV